jgi:hypothetical protein
MAGETLRAKLIQDAQQLDKKHPGLLSREFYRKHGSFSEREWHKAFRNFREFLYAAGLRTKTTTDNKQTPYAGPDYNNVPQLQSKPVFTESSEFIGDKWNLNIPRTHINDIATLLKERNVDPDEWVIERQSIKQWEMGSKDADGNAVITPLWAVSATLIPNKAYKLAKAEVASLKESAKEAARVPKPVIRTSIKSGNMLEISLNDAHFGKLAWPRETGGAPYDTRIAQKTFLTSVEHLLDRAKGYTFDSILFVVGNDLLQADNVAGTTTKGTQVDCDTRYYKTFEIVRETITQCIERFREIAPVTVKMVQGNHDLLSVWHLGDSLSALFGKYEDVVIDNEPTYRKYHQWGKCGLMLTHGDKGKRADFPLLFATERSDIFGATKFREIHTGHLHSTKTEEFHGVRVRILPSLSPADSWHSENGFTGQQRVAEAYVFNKEEGLIAQFYHNADA